MIRFSIPNDSEAVTAVLKPATASDMGQASPIAARTAATANIRRQGPKEPDDENVVKRGRPNKP